MPASRPSATPRWHASPSNNRFTDSNGVERTITEILASQVSVIGGTLQ